MDGSERRKKSRFRAVASAISTWTFHILFGLFNIAVLWIIILRYGVRLSSLCFDTSHYTLVLGFVPPVL